MHVAQGSLSPVSLSATSGPFATNLTSLSFLHEYRESSMISLTETWLTDVDPDPTIPNFTFVRSDRTDATMKTRGGGIGIFVNENWCKNISVKYRYCDMDIEYLAVGLRPFYLPREFPNIISITASIHST